MTAKRQGKYPPHMGTCSPYATTVKISGNWQEEFSNEIIEKKYKKKIYFLVNFSRFLSSRSISGLHFNELLI